MTIRKEVKEGRIGKAGVSRASPKNIENIFVVVVASFVQPENFLYFIGGCMT